MAFVSLLACFMAQATPAKVTGIWTIEITFNSGPAPVSCASKLKSPAKALFYSLNTGSE